MKTFISNIFNAISDNLISGGAYYTIFKSILVTLFMTLTAWIVAAALGILVSYLMCYEKKAASRIAAREASSNPARKSASISGVMRSSSAWPGTARHQIA